MFTELVRVTAGWLQSEEAASLRARCGERGATAVEYALMAGLIAVVIVSGVTLFGLEVKDLFLVPAGVFNVP